VHDGVYGVQKSTINMYKGCAFAMAVFDALGVPDTFLFLVIPLSTYPSKSISLMR
jgi:hypothetical protein